MKICFLLQRRFAYVGHNMAVLLNEKYPGNQFCGYVYVREGFDFLASQKDLKYTSLVLDEDVHAKYGEEKIDIGYLKFLEQEYGFPNLWAYIDLDRIIRHNLLVREYPYDTPVYSHEDMIKIFQGRARAIEEFLDRENPNVIIFSAIGAIASLLLYNMAAKRGIKILTLEPARIGIKHTLSQSYKTFTYADSTYEDYSKYGVSDIQIKGDAMQFIKEFRNQPKSYTPLDALGSRPVSKISHFRFLAPAKFALSLSWFIKMCVNYFFGNFKHDYSTQRPWHYIVDRLRRKARVLVGFGDLYDKIDIKEDFVFFPLQLEPELTTLLFSPLCGDQLWLIKQIARSLPIHFKLYVKEHPGMVGYRRRSFYKSIKKIPNVKLIAPNIEGFHLIQNAQLVTSLSGTAGWEAVLLGKPIITFGDIFYNTLPTARRCDSIGELPHIIRELLRDFKPDDNHLIDFVSAIYKESVDVDLIHIWEVEGGGSLKGDRVKLLPLVELIAEKIGLKK